MDIRSVQVGDKLVSGRLRLIASQPTEPETSKGSPGKTAGSVVGGIGAGFVTKSAWAGFQATNTTSAGEIAKLLTENGLAAEHAPSVAQQVEQVLKAEPTKVLLVAVAAGGATWAVLEASGRLFGFEASIARKLVISALVALAAGVAYYFARSAGYVS